MKLKTTMFFAAFAVTAGTAFSQTTRIFDITGATAFRASANNAIIEILGGAGVTEYAFTGTSGISGTNRAIFKGTMAAFPNDTIIVRASWSGSTLGIKDVADQAEIQFLNVTNPVSTTGTNLGVSPAPDAIFTTAVAQWSFSDVDKLLSERPNHTFGGGPVGVVPFMFLAGEGAPEGLTNMTDQLHDTLWSSGFLPMAFLTNDITDTRFALATGRNNGSGTRATILAETQYGAFRNVTQFGATMTGDRLTGTLTALTEFNNGGNSSNSGVRDLLTRTPVGNMAPYVFVSYLTISDALVAITEGAKEMTYNGVSFSADNVKKGLYSLWGYQQFYLDNDATADQLTFDAAFRAAIPSTLNGIDAIAISEMSVTRTGGDGGPIVPGDRFPNP
jgi:hypothetical protein